MKTTITVISDNIENGDLKGEWGLAMIVEYNGKKLLVDTGASEVFAANMKKLGFDIADIDYAALSHAHYDHGFKKITFIVPINLQKGGMFVVKSCH